MSSVLLVACGSTAGSSGGVAGSGSVVTTPGATVQLSGSADATLAALTRDLDDAHKLDTPGLLAKHALGHGTDLGYDPSTAAGLETIQASKLALNDAEQQLLRQSGFVVSARQSFPSMLYAYAELYAADLPLYVTADSLLDALHLSYDSILRDVELASLRGSLARVLDGMRQALAAHGGDPASADADLFLAIAKSLLDGQTAAPVAGSDVREVEAFVSAAKAAAGAREMELFGTRRNIDFSQFTPRAHYVDTPELQRYFRTMMWLGRVDLRLIETLPDGSQVFRRRQFDAMLLLRSLLSDALLAEWTRIDVTLQAFVGKSDYMRLPEVDALLADLGVDAGGVAGVSDQRVAQTILDKGYGAQLIASQLMVNDTLDGHTLPLDRSFALFGQRYVIDSHVLSNVVYDRVKARLMPSALDVAYAAFGNDAALPLLQSELDKYAYAGALEGTRLLADAHGDAFWNSNLYNGWLGALRGLSPRASDVLDPAAVGMPRVTRTEAWSRRILGTQLASWAELRHDTVLYAKQSYTSAPACEYPDAYVDPYPAVFAALSQLAQRGVALADQLQVDSTGLQAQIRGYFAHLQSVSDKLAQMAEAQRTGTPFSGEQLAFINEAVHSYNPPGCGGPRVFDGWFAKLIYGVGDDGKVASALKPVITDVHTQPTDENGAADGRVLHVGTGKTRLMVVTVDTCRGPRAYAGPALSYYESVTQNFDRLTDERWALQFTTDSPQDVPWTSAYVR